MAHAPRNARRGRSEIGSAPSRDQESAVLQQPFCGLDSPMRTQANPTKLTKLTDPPPPTACGRGEGVGPCTAPASTRRIPTLPTTPRCQNKVSEKVSNSIASLRTFADIREHSRKLSRLTRHARWFVAPHRRRFALATGLAKGEDAMRPIIKITLCALAAAAVAGAGLRRFGGLLSEARRRQTWSKSKGWPREGGRGQADRDPVLVVGRHGRRWTGPARQAKYGAVAGAHRDEGLGVAEKRQHGWVTVAAPAARVAGGAVRVKVKFPWLDCKVGRGLSRRRAAKRRRAL